MGDPHLVPMMDLAGIAFSPGRAFDPRSFPSGGGGYVVASKLLGPTVGLVSGAALLVELADGNGLRGLDEPARTLGELLDVHMLLVPV